MMRLIHEVMQLCAYLTEMSARYRSVLRNIFRQTNCNGEKIPKLHKSFVKEINTCWNKNG